MIQPKVKLLIQLSCYFLLTILSNVCFALDSDQNKVLHVTADSADLSQKNHHGTYTGHVNLTQGTTNIIADNAVTEGSIKNELTLAIANGSKNQQAHYWTETEPDKPPFHAYANSIRYYPARHLIELVGNARVEQGKNSLSADVITYDTLAQHVVTKNNGKKRTSIVIYPEKKPT